MRSDDVFELIATLRQRGQAFCVATIVRTEDATSAKAGAKAVVTEDGVIHGFLGGSCLQGAVLRTANEVLTARQPRLIRVKPTTDVATRLDTDGVELHKSHCPSGGTADIFVEPMVTPTQLVVCGGSPVALAVAALGGQMEYRVTVAALSEDLPHHDATLRGHTGFDLTELDLDVRSAVVVATQGKRDKDALVGALASQAGYVGFVCSQRKATAMVKTLQELGTDPGTLVRIHAPAGLRIHAIEPTEIAVSILGELVAWRRGPVRDRPLIVGDE